MGKVGPSVAVALHVPCWLWPCLCPAGCGPVCALLAVALYVPCWLWPCLCPAGCGPVRALLAVALYVPCWLWPCLCPAGCGPVRALLAVALYVPCWLWPCTCPAVRALLAVDTQVTALPPSFPGAAAVKAFIDRPEWSHREGLMEGSVAVRSVDSTRSLTTLPLLQLILSS